ncbi:hypothetical protein H4Q26_017425 [Puccinia striiformis f. sp. tritici PST-130]|nr:hypothetical protein H4Q26_017425 [Puccinia striiformis f. sp. tritici PST-130]
MPGLDGLSATRQIREYEAHFTSPEGSRPVPIIALTANYLLSSSESLEIYPPHISRLIFRFDSFQRRNPLSSVQRRILVEPKYKNQDFSRPDQFIMLR